MKNEKRGWKIKLKKRPFYYFDIDQLLWVGIFVIIVASVCQHYYPDIPSIVYTFSYLFAILCLVVYMFEIQYRRRTGDDRDEKQTGERRPRNAKKKNRK